MTGRNLTIGGTEAGVLALAWGAMAQASDPGAAAAQWLKKHTENRLQLSFESRGRYENRDGVAFGKEPDRFTGLYRTRLGDRTWGMDSSFLTLLDPAVRSFTRNPLATSTTSR